MNYSKYMTATDLMNICDMLEGKEIGKKGSYNSLYNILINLIGIEFSLKGEELRNKLIKNINDLMYIDSNNILQYKEF